MKSLLCKILCFVLVITGVFGIVDTLDTAKAQAPVPVQTFKSTYKGYNPSLASRSSYTPAQKCTKTMTIYGAKPAAAGTYPVLIYVHGTFGDWGGNTEGQTFVKHAAAQGFAAMALTYDSSSTNTASGYAGHAYCMFDQNHASNGLTTSCATLGADCSRGALVSGFSQGGIIAMIAKNYTPNVNAVWAIGVTSNIFPKNTVLPYAMAAPNGTRVLPNNKLVINTGQYTSSWTKDLYAHELPSLKKRTGVDCGTSYQCLTAAGNGFYVVQNSEVADKKADHCYWEGNSGCGLAPKNLEVGFQPPATTNWSMIRNLDWLRAQL